MADDTPKALFDFTGADAAKEWQTINDGVMGGVSEGTGENHRSLMAKLEAMK